MKKIVAILVAGLFTTGVFAQSKTTEQKTDQKKAASPMMGSGSSAAKDKK